MAVHPDAKLINSLIRRDGFDEDVLARVRLPWRDPNDPLMRSLAVCESVLIKQGQKQHLA
jgi:hypothetical protein